MTTDETPADQTPAERPVSRKARELNEEIRYTSWSVFKAVAELPEDEGLRAGYAEEVEQLFDQARRRPGRRRARHLRHRGPACRRRPDDLGARPVRRGAAGALLLVPQDPARPVLRADLDGHGAAPAAEFNKSHIPAFLAARPPRDWACVYPFVRSYEWYLLPDEERRALLAEHGKMSRDYPDVRANTVPSFALGDYEWLLCFEADELHRIVDLMRHLRGSETRRHVRDRGPVLHRPPQVARRNRQGSAVTGIVFAGFSTGVRRHCGRPSLIQH